MGQRLWSLTLRDVGTDERSAEEKLWLGSIVMA